MNSERFNAYRLNWVFCSFDLPTNTKEERKIASEFRLLLLKSGFSMFQYSVYARPSASIEHANAIINKVIESLPQKGNVMLFRITDKQFEKILMIFSKVNSPEKKTWKQLELF